MTSDNPPPYNPFSPLDGAPDAQTPANDAGQAAVDARVAAAEAKAAELKDQALRALAEAENTRRRAQREIEDNNKYAVANFARDVLPVLDNLRRALDSIPADARAADEKLGQFATGVELTERDLLSTLERYKVQRVDPLGKPFDHNLHQAVMQVDSDKVAGTIVQVLQSGYVIHDRLLRPAMVAVSKGVAPKVDTSA